MVLNFFTIPQPIKILSLKSVFSLLFIFISFQTLAETPDLKYFRLCLKGEGFYEVKKYKQSTEAYTQAFQIPNIKIKTQDRYNAACSWSLAGFIDSAYIQLYLATATGYDDYYHILSDPDLESLHPDRRWKPLLDSIQKNKAKNAIGPYAHLRRLLESVFYTDQKYRMMIEGYEKKYGHNSKEMRALWDSTLKQDAANLKIIKQVLDMYGWLGEDAIGSQANSTLFLVIQHSDQETQEKYLPLMREAVKKGNARPADLALLEDRVALKQGKKQIYGSQLSQDPETGKYKVSPIEDEANVNKRRAEVGLEPLEEYVKYWGIEYKLPLSGQGQKLSFWETHIVKILLLISILLFVFISFLFTKFFRAKVLSSALYWLYVIAFTGFLYGWLKEINSAHNYSPIKSLLFSQSCFCIVVGSIALINFCLYKLFKRKHFLLELLAVAIGPMLLTLSAGTIHKLFYPNSRTVFFFNIIPSLIALGIFLLIRIVIYLITKIRAKLK